MFPFCPTLLPPLPHRGLRLRVLAERLVLLSVGVSVSLHGDPWILGLWVLISLIAPEVSPGWPCRPRSLPPAGSEGSQFFPPPSPKRISGQHSDFGQPGQEIDGYEVEPTASHLHFSKYSQG